MRAKITLPSDAEIEEQREDPSQDFDLVSSSNLRENEFLSEGRRIRQETVNVYFTRRN